VIESRRLFGTNGIRGVVNEDLTPEFALKIGGAIGTFFRRGRILLGYDGRISNLMLASAVSSGLMSAGCDVYNAGMGPTPCIQFAVSAHHMDGGVMITASHNPPYYNGIKVVARDGVEIPRKQEMEIEAVFFENREHHAEWDQIGQIHAMPNVLEEYKEAIKKHVDVQTIIQKGYHVVVDAANGVGGLVTPYLLRDLGCRVTTINANIDGAFPNRLPEPRPENLRDLMVVVKATRADFGVAFDGDADRAIFVDEEGEPQWGDRTFALVEEDFLKQHHGEAIVTPVSSSRVVMDIAEKHGGRVVWTRVGSTVVSYTMKEIKARLGGEENGGVFYGAHQPVRDGAMTTALILGIMAKTGKKLSQLLNGLPRYYLEKDKIECPNELKETVLKKLARETKHLNPETVDGVKLLFADKSSILIRPSGTEAIYRLYAEAKTKEKATSLVREYRERLQELIAP
jgi:phosphomannomutase/phosphoglucomutase